jgi:hypothetical protein
MMRVKPIKADQTYTWLLNRHYAKRIPPISYAFGLYDDELVGVITYGTPVSSALRVGIAGPEFKVLELNRLCLNSTNKNAASFLVAHSIKQLPKNNIIVSYADTSMGHHGYVYQASNFIYTGLSAKRTDWKLRGQEHLHGATVADMSRGQENRAEYMRERFGDDFYLEDRPRKHRYLFANGPKPFKKRFMANLNYDVEPYPKGENSNYDDSGHTTDQLSFL